MPQALRLAREQDQRVLCVTDDVHIAAAVSRAFGERADCTDCLQVIASSESVFTTNAADCLVLVGADAVGVSALRPDAVVAVGEHGDDAHPPDFDAGAPEAWPPARRQVVVPARDVGRAVKAMPLSPPEVVDVVPPRTRPRLLVVANSPGAGGASTLAWAIALAGKGLAVLVDADSRSAGLDLWVQAESLPASRWPDIQHLREDVSRPQITSALISVTQQCLLLSQGRSRTRPDWTALSHVVTGLAVDDVVVVDVSSDTTSDFATAALAAADDIIMVVAPTVSSCAAAVTLLADIADGPARTVIAVRGQDAELGERTLTTALNPRVLMHVPEDRRFIRSLPDAHAHRAVSRRWRRALIAAGLITVARHDPTVRRRALQRVQ